MEGADLHGADLTSANLTGADLSNATLTGATLMGADLLSANLQGANLIDADMRGALDKCLDGDTQLSKLSCDTIPNPLPGADLTNATLIGANLAGANFEGATIHGTDGKNDANFQGATSILDAKGLPEYVPCELPDNLRDAKLAQCDFKGVDLYGADLTNATLTGADLSNATLTGAALMGADLLSANLQGANLIDADMRGAVDKCLDGDTQLSKLSCDTIPNPLPGADLTNATLIGANLAGANFEGATIRGTDGKNDANFQGATSILDAKGLPEYVPCELPDNLRDAKLAQCDFKGVDLYGADLTNATLTGADLSNATLTGAALMGADLLSANLQGADLTGADMRGAVDKCLDGDTQLSKLSCDTIPNPLPGADLSNATLTEATLIGANLAGANLEGSDLTGAHLNHLPLPGTPIPGADLREATLIGANLKGANFEGATIHGTDGKNDANFQGATYILHAKGLPEYVPCELPDDLRGAWLVKCDLYGEDLSGKKLTGAVLNWANLRGQSVIIHESDDNKQTFLRINDYRDANIDSFDEKYFRQSPTLSFTGTDLTGAHLGGAYLRYADLSGQTLDDSLEGADLTGAVLWAADLTGAIMYNAIFVEADLKGASLKGNKKLTNADFSRADLTGADLTDTAHTRTAFTGAALIDANLDGADLTRADFSHADMSNATMMDTKFGSVSMKYTTLVDAKIEPKEVNVINMTGANLEGTQIRGIWQSGTIDITEKFGNACHWFGGSGRGNPYCSPIGDLKHRGATVVDRNAQPHPNPTVWFALCMAPGALDFVVPVTKFTLVADTVNVGNKALKVAGKIQDLNPAAASAKKLLSIAKPVEDSGDVVITVGKGAKELSKTVNVGKTAITAELVKNDASVRAAVTAGLATTHAAGYSAIEHETTGTGIFGWVVDKFKFVDPSFYVSKVVGKFYDCTCNAPGWYKLTKDPAELMECPAP